MAKAFIIRNKETKEQFIATSGKRVWSSTGAAKQAFYRTYEWKLIDGRSRRVATRFDNQDVYEIVEINDNDQSSQLDKAVSLLRLAQGRCDYTLNAAIENFLNGLEE